jgi:hypothetical protein
MMYQQMYGGDMEIPEDTFEDAEDKKEEENNEEK